MIYSTPIRNVEYVIGTATIEHCTMGRRRWSHVLGNRFSDDPSNQSDVNLTVSLDKVINGEGSVLKGSMENVAIKVGGGRTSEMMPEREIMPCCLFCLNGRTSEMMPGLS